MLGPGGSGYLTNITAITAGYTLAGAEAGRHRLDLGLQPFRALGDGTTTDSSTPVQVLGPGGSGYLTNITAIAAGAFHALALRQDGTVWTWGYNYYGRLGDGTTTDSSTPVQVLGPGGSGYLTNITAIAAGYYHSLALRQDGTVWTWGYNYAGAARRRHHHRQLHPRPGARPRRKRLPHQHHRHHRRL